jgi:hypothetical protein
LTSWSDCLGYLTRGQSSPTLRRGRRSDGKWVSELAKGLPYSQIAREGQLPEELLRAGGNRRSACTYPTARP